MSKTYERDEQAELIRAVKQGRESIGGAAARLGVPPSTAYGGVRAAADAGRPAQPPHHQRRQRVGYRSFATFRTDVLFHCGGLSQLRPGESAANCYQARLLMSSRAA